MPIDASIYGQIQQPAPINPLADAAQYQQLQALQNQNKLASLGFADRQQAQQDQNTLRNALLGLGANATDDQRISALKGTGLPAGFTQADALQKSLLDRQKTGADVASKTAETAGKVFDNFQAQLGTVQTPQEAAQFIVSSYHDPVVGPMLQQHGSLEDGIGRLQQAISQPGGFEQWRAGAAIGIRKLAELAKVQQVNLGGTMQTQVVQPATGQTSVLSSAPITQSADSVAQNATSRANNQANVGATIRGQNLTDARARELNTATMTKPFEVTGADGNPMLVQQDKQGTITPVTGYGPKSGSAKPLTDTQAKALLFGSRMQESAKILDGMSAKGVDTPGIIKSGADSIGLGGLVNTLPSALGGPSADQQSVEQAQRDFVNAVLRRESGAAIAPSEFESARKQYFPAVGDSAQVKTQKKANRDLAIKGLLAEVPAGQRASLSAPADATPAVPAASGGWSVKRVN